jgi:hypothetical protein
MPENHRTLLPDKGLAAQISQRRNDRLGGGTPGADIIGPVAIALVLEIAPTGRAMARAFRHQHRESPRHQPGRQRAVFALRHLRATQHVLRRGVRNQRKPKRPIAGRAKQYRARGGLRIGRGDQPLLHAIRLPFRPLRAKSGLRRRGLGTENSEHWQGKKRSQQLHKSALTRPKRRLSDSRAAYARRIKSGAFFREDGIAEGPFSTIMPRRPSVKCRPKGPPVLFRHSLMVKLMHKIHRLTDN